MKTMNPLRAPSWCGGNRFWRPACVLLADASGLCLVHFSDMHAEDAGKECVLVAPAVATAAAGCNVACERCSHLHHQALPLQSYCCCCRCCRCASPLQVSVSGIGSSRLDFAARGLQEVARASVHYYNSEQELQALVAALQELVASTSS